MTRSSVRTSIPRQTLVRTSILLLFLSLGVFVPGAAGAAEARRHVVDGAEIQARLDQQHAQESADRQAIQELLGQPSVRQVAESAGLDLKRAEAAAALLSGSELRDLASSARELNAGIGGDRTFTVTATTLIIVLLLVILLTR